MIVRLKTYLKTKLKLYLGDQMTGEKNRYTTTEKLWNLDDKTLSTPAHDEMVLWLLNKDNLLNTLQLPTAHNTVFKTLSNGLDYKLWECAQYIFGKNSNIWELLESNGLPSFPDTYDLELFHKVWNEMVREFNICNDSKVKNLNVHILSETPITATNGFLVGYTDVQLQVITTELYDGKYFKQNYPFSTFHYIEVKPIIKSFGETLRQLNTYRHYLEIKNNYHDNLGDKTNIPFELYLFTTDMRFKDAFESQNIKVLTYPTH